MRCISDIDISRLVLGRIYIYVIGLVLRYDRGREGGMGGGEGGRRGMRKRGGAREEGEGEEE